MEDLMKRLARVRGLPQAVTLIALVTTIAAAATATQAQVCDKCTYSSGSHWFSGWEVWFETCEQNPAGNPSCRSCEEVPEGHEGCHINSVVDTLAGCVTVDEITGHPDCVASEEKETLALVAAMLRQNDLTGVAQWLEGGNGSAHVAFNEPRHAIQLLGCGAQAVFLHYPIEDQEVWAMLSQAAELGDRMRPTRQQNE
jgi:hypothetical protein